ncbi:YeiH family protein [Gorillibacterium timonense]|uniref:YeiH family protein n=1 Tax=Gorillibacterium timonense TaxID=1689269 RepID=UPI0011DD6D0E|nr:YeiH family protein [Gorillibacterium timonense]
MSGRTGQGVKFALGVGLTLLLAAAAKQLADLPFLRIMGQLVIAILLGMIWRASLGVPTQVMSGASFSSKRLLRYGIILLGMRLNLQDIVQAGPKILLLAVVNVGVTITVVYGTARLLKVRKPLGILTACGTAICGAAAVVAISPQVKADDDEIAIGAATVAILGTLFTLLYTFLYPVLGLTPHGYGVFSGATLHEVAHVVAAADPVGKAAVDPAVVVKLTRVALLVPVAIVIGAWTHRGEALEGEKGSEGGWKRIPIPWFVVGFLLMSGVNTARILPEGATAGLITAAYMLIAMAMAGLGLNVDLVTFRRLGMKPFAAGLLGSVVLSVMGYILVLALGLN